MTTLLEFFDRRWQSYSSRERSLLVLLGALAFGTILIFGVLMPGHRFALRQERAAEAAVRELVDVQASADAVLALRQASAKLGGDATLVRRAVADHAQALGLMLVEDSEEGGGVALRLRGPSSGAVLEWAETLPASTGTRVSRLVIEAAPDGVTGVSAEALVEPAID